MIRKPPFAFLLLGILTAHALSPSAADDASLGRAIDEMAREAIQSGATAALSIGVRRAETIVHAKGYGLADVENQVAATEHTVYRIGSVTKQFTSAAIMQLLEKKKIGFDDELTKFLPDYPTQEHKVTIEHLLNHTSGIQSYTSMGKNFWSLASNDLTHEEMIDLFAPMPFTFSPGEKFLYNNSGYYLLSVVIEKASGQTYAEYLAEHVYPRADLEATYYMANRPIIAGRAEGCDRRPDGFVNDDLISMKLPFSAGSLGSTVLDLLKWSKALAEGKVVSLESYEHMTTPRQLNDGKPLSYGFGLFVGKLGDVKKISHGGGIYGFRSALALYPEHDLGIAVLSNTGNFNTDALEQKIARMALGLTEE